MSDIEGPAPHEEVAPKPWTDADRNLDKAALVRELIVQHPHAGADDVAAMLDQRNVRVSGLLVAAEMLKLKQQRRTRLAWQGLAPPAQPLTADNRGI